MPPATRPTVLETLATTGGYPKNSSIGNVINVPDPTIVLMVPAAIPAASSATTSYQGTRSPHCQSPVYNIHSGNVVLRTGDFMTKRAFRPPRAALRRSGVIAGAAVLIASLAAGCSAVKPAAGGSTAADAASN